MVKQPPPVPEPNPVPERTKSAGRPAGVSSSLDKLLITLELDEAGDTKAAIARALAKKLDQASTDRTGAVAMAISGIAKELRDLIDALTEDTSARDAFVASLFTEVGDPEVA